MGDNKLPKKLTLQELERLEEIYSEMVNLQRELNDILKNVSLPSDYSFGKYLDPDDWNFLDVLRRLQNLLRNEILDVLWEEYEKSKGEGDNR